MTQKKRGRQSTADKAVCRPVVAFSKRLPPPPAKLTQDQQEIWRGVLGSHAGDYITPDCFPLLEDYCGAVTASRRIGAEFERFEATWRRTKMV
jgi:hypothetical protein